MEIINPRSLSFENVKSDAIAYIESLPDSVSWKDQYLSSDGSIQLDLLTGFAIWMANKYANSRLESYNKYARLRTSLIELAKGKGIFIPPSKPRTLTFDFTSDYDLSLDDGEIVGTLGEYSIILIGGYEVTAGTPINLKAYIANKFETTIVAESSKLFQSITIDIPGKYITEEDEVIQVNSLDINVRTSPITNKNSVGISDNTILRYMDENKIHMRFGNGSIGKLLLINDNITYKCTYYNDNVDDLVLDDISLSYGVGANYVELIKAEKYLDTEVIRSITELTSHDGTLNDGKSYRAEMHYTFGNYFYDIHLVDEYPTDVFYLLPNDLYTSEIYNLILDRFNRIKGTAVQLQYNVLQPSQGVDLEFSYRYSSTNYNKTQVQNMVDTYLLTKSKKIVKEAIVMSTYDLSVELNKLDPNVFFYIDSLVGNQEVSLAELKYINSYTINLRS